MGCAHGSAADKDLEIKRLKLEAAEKDLELKRRDLEARSRELTSQSPQAPASGAPTSAGGSPGVQDGEYLSMSTIEQGMGVRVTDSKSRLQQACRTSGLQCDDQRIMLLNEPGVVLRIDPSDSTAEVEWEGKKGFMPVDSLVKCDSARAEHASRSSAGGVDLSSAADLLRLLASLGGADAADAPVKPYVASQGFHFHCDLRSIQVDGAKKKATCVANAKATVFTEEVITQGQPCEFLVKVGNAAKGLAIGVTKKVPNGYSNHLLGEAGFEGTMGALVTNTVGMVMHDEKAAGIAPPVADGDIVGLRVRDGKIHFIKNGTSFMEFQASGPIRFGVSLCEPGSTATIVDPDQRSLPALSTGQLKAGRQVRVPSSTDERLKSMRVRWNSSMLPHCGQVGDVLEVSQRSAKVSVGGTSFHWDLEVFDAQQKRFCHCGCDLRARKVESNSVVCDVCRALNPIGSQTFRCDAHDYDICTYCNGQPTLPEAGSKVIRGPTWKWGSQDGQAYAEGTVCPKSAADKDGWFAVEWGTGKTNRYRGPPFQDVVLARENGLKGSTPMADGDQPVLDDLLKALMGALAGASQDDCQELPAATYKADGGWHFNDRLKSIAVDDTRKVAVCKQTRDATVVTEEVIDAADGTFTFAVKVCCASGSDTSPGPITVGIVGGEPKGFSTHVIGHEGFKNCIGAMCHTEGGAIVHEGKIAGDAPGVGDGDVVSVCIQSGSCEWSRNGVKFHSCGVRGKFRFGVSMLRQGQSVEIHSFQAAPLDLNLGSVPHVAWGSQLKVAMEDKSQQLGVGAFGETWKAKLGDQAVAVKLLKQDKLTPELRADFAREVKALAGLTLPGGEAHPYLLRLIAVVPEKFAIVTELCASDLAAHLKVMKNQLVFETRTTLARQIAVGMAWLAERQYVHRDLKMQNVLVDSVGVARIADFGLARPVADIESQVAGTVIYMAPECFDGHFSQKSDVYSHAFIMWGIFTGGEVDVMGFLTARRAIVGHLVDKVQDMLVEAIRRGDRPDVPSSVPERVSAQIKACWHKDPCKRPTFESVSSDLRQLLL